MATRKSKNAEEERLEDTNIEKVIKLLEPGDGSKPITKKLACELLNISYNTTRLGTILEKYKEKKERESRFRAERRGKPATQDEIQYTITEYMRGAAVSVIAEELYRSAGLVNQILDDYGVPRRGASYDYFKPEMVPEEAMRNRFTIGEVVYSTRYDSLAKVEAEQLHASGAYVYRLWLLSDKWLQFCYQPAYELASLDHLRKLGIKL